MPRPIAVDLDALARSCHQATQPTTPEHLLLSAGLPVVHVITDLGPVNHAAILRPATLGPVFGQTWKIHPCAITHTGPQCPGPRCRYR